MGSWVMIGLWPTITGRDVAAGAVLPGLATSITLAAGFFPAGLDLLGTFFPILMSHSVSCVYNISKLMIIQAGAANEQPVYTFDR